MAKELEKRIEEIRAIVFEGINICGDGLVVKEEAMEKLNNPVYSEEYFLWLKGLWLNLDCISD